MAITTKGIVGYQRKTLPDLVSSLYDGRLYKELAQLHATGTVAYPFLLLEYDPARRTTDDDPIDANITLSQLRSIIAKFALSNVATLTTFSTLDTLRCVISTSKYIATTKGDIPKRPKQTDNQWGITTSESYGAFLLQSFPAVGPTIAKAIYDAFGGVPLAWTVTRRPRQGPRYRAQACRGPNRHPAACDWLRAPPRAIIAGWLVAVLLVARSTLSPGPRCNAPARHMHRPMSHALVFTISCLDTLLRNHLIGLTPISSVVGS